MATILSRSLKRLRYVNRNLSQWRSPMSSPPHSGSTLHRALPLLQSVVPLGLGIRSSAVSQICLFGSSAATVNPENQTSKSSGEAKSGNGEHSGGSHESSDAGKSVRGGPISWLSFLLLVATGAGVIFYYDKEKKRHIEEINNASKAVKEGPSVGKAAIGGPFNLINHEGKHVTEKNFLGKWTLIYFGFTHCPDICPDELQKLAAAVDKISKFLLLILMGTYFPLNYSRCTCGKLFAEGMCTPGISQNYVLENLVPIKNIIGSKLALPWSDLLNTLSGTQSPLEVLGHFSS